MARTQKDVVDYFPHDANASSSDTLTVLQSKFGNNGYAFWFKLLEKLASTEGHCCDCSNPVKWQLFIARMGVDEITTVEIMKLLVEMKAIDKTLWKKRLIWCQNLVDNLSHVYTNRRRDLPKKPLNTDGKGITTVDNDITTTESTHSIVKYSIGKYSNIEVPSFIKEETWLAFLEMRKEIKAPMTEKAVTMMFNRLGELKEQGSDPNKVLEQSIMNNWKGVFPINDGTNYKITDKQETSMAKSPTHISKHFKSPEEVFGKGYNKAHGLPEEDDSAGE